ncbi:MAG: sigma-70 family RNA polymerase sigma factor [Parabacteroides sp.]|nr:sigma-70 family RNA polymerase sigma factor [Parabacteroides sp.]MDD6080878.1 sigma-70 family RNA polymerase sigma factor [bacterium]MCI7008519.1 sigma-70 family RNA polymerase sigma factor [Parabacteroides sp.]MCI7783726.1 sigma-70 family RNA polymerase sigma factor [Parabacteroides sp.]MDD7062846.1 sigma-70 family RNA polymerase sigma factor [bacterium]
MEAETFKQRFLSFHPKLYRIALALVESPEDAEDILQEAYTKLWSKRDSLEAVQQPEAFAVTIVRNLCLDFLRSPRTNSRSEPLETVILHCEDSPERQVETRDQLRQVVRLIQELPPNQQQVIRLRGMEDCSVEEIAEITGFSPANVRTLLSRARKYIKGKLKKENL